MNETLKQLKDIKPPVEVPDHSLLLLLGSVALVLLLVALFVLLFKRKSAKKRRKDRVAAAKARLAKIDFEDSKEAVYAFDELFPIAANGDEELLREFGSLWPRLEKYKYKRVVPPLDEKDISSMRSLIERVVK